MSETKKSEKSENTKKKSNEVSTKSKVIAIVRVRGIRNMKPKIKYTLSLLNLNKPNHCVLYPYSDQTIGMLKIVKDYVAYGCIEDGVALKLIMKRGEKGKLKLRSEKQESSKKIAETYLSGLKSGKGPRKMRDVLDPVFRLRPPRHGHKNIKKHYPVGVLGKWDDINQLISRML